MLVQQVLVHGVPFGTGNKQAAAVIFHFVKVLRQYADLVAAGDLKIGQTHFVAGKRCRSIRKAEQRNDDMAVKPKAEPDEIYAEMDAAKIIEAIKAGNATYSYNGGADTAITAADQKIIIDNVAFEVSGDGTRLTFKQIDKDEKTSSGGNVDGRMDVTVSVVGKAITDGEFGDYNKSTTNITNKGDNAADTRFASTYFDLTM